VLLTIEFQVKKIQTMTQFGMNLSEAQEQRLLQLNELDEIRQDAKSSKMHFNEPC